MYLFSQTPENCVNNYTVVEEGKGSRTRKQQKRPLAHLYSCFCSKISSLCVCMLDKSKRVGETSRTSDKHFKQEVLWAHKYTYLPVWMLLTIICYMNTFRQFSSLGLESFPGTSKSDPSDANVCALSRSSSEKHLGNVISTQLAWKQPKNNTWRSRLCFLITVDLRASSTSS